MLRSFGPAGPGAHPSSNAGSMRRASIRRNLATFAADFEVHGAQVIERVRKEDPSTYLKVASGLLPKQSELDINIDVLHRALNWKLSAYCAMRRAPSWNY
jgi:hypothetical protein